MLSTAPATVQPVVVSQAAARQAAYVATRLQNIYELAKRQDKAGLTALLATGVNVDVVAHNMTAVQRLAEEGDINSVRFLTDYFGASLNCALLGFAKIGNHEQALELLSDGAALTFAIEGFARGGHAHLLEIFLACYPWLVKQQTPDELLTTIKAIKSAITPPDHADTPLPDFERSEEITRHHTDLVNAAVQGSAAAGNLPLAKQFLEAGASIHYYFQGLAEAGYKWADIQASAAQMQIGMDAILWKAVCLGYAAVGNSEMLAEVMAEGLALHEVVTACGRYGYADLALAFQLQDPTKCELAYPLALARGGLPLAEVSRCWAYHLALGMGVAGKTHEVVAAFAEGVHLIQVSQLLAAHPTAEMLEKAAYGLLQAGCFTNAQSALRTLSFIPDSTVRQQLYTTAKFCGYFQLPAEYQANLLQEANTRHQLMLQGHHTYRTAQLLCDQLKRSGLQAIPLQPRTSLQSVLQNAGSYVSGLFNNATTWFEESPAAAAAASPAERRPS